MVHAVGKEEMKREKGRCEKDEVQAPLRVKSHLLTDTLAAFDDDKCCEVPLKFISPVLFKATLLHEDKMVPVPSREGRL